MYYYDEWGTVCDEGWDLDDAQVVCRQLGYGPPIAARYRAYYGQGSGQIWLDNLNCNGDESTIGECRHAGWGMHYCVHNEDAGLECAANGNSDYITLLLVHVIARFAVVFGINCTSNAGRKLVIVQGTAKLYYCFLPALQGQLIPNTTVNHAITIIMFFLNHVIYVSNV